MKEWNFKEMEMYVLDLNQAEQLEFIKDNLLGEHYDFMLIDNGKDLVVVEKSNYKVMDYAESITDIYDITGYNILESLK